MEFLQPIINGSVAGTIAVLITNPFDLAKTRLQIQGELQSKGSYQRYYSGVINALLKTSKQEGIFALYNGITAAITFQIIMNGIRFGMYDNIKRYAQSNSTYYQNNESVKLVSNITISACVGYVSSLVSSPFNMMKTRLMLQSEFIPHGTRYHYTGLTNAIGTIWKSEGFHGLYVGSPIMACRTALGSAVQLPAFDQSLKYTRQIPINHWLQTMLASATSTLLLCVITCPIEGITTRYFNQPFDQNGHGLVYKGAIEAFGKIAKVEGILGLYKGLVGLLWRSGPQSFISLIIVNRLNQLEDKLKSH